jgi:hypothetical protein
MDQILIEHAFECAPDPVGVAYDPRTPAERYVRPRTIHSDRGGITYSSRSGCVNNLALTHLSNANC